MKTKLEFRNRYRAILLQLHEKGTYSWPVSQLDDCVDKMMKAIEENNFNNDGPALKKVLKDAGIKSTYTAIKQFWITLS